MARKRKHTQMNPRLQTSLELHISGIGLAVRTVNMLEAQGISTVEDLLYCCPGRRVECRRGPTRKGPCNNKHLLDIPSFGDKTLEEVFRAVEKLGFERYT